MTVSVLFTSFSRELVHTEDGGIYFQKPFLIQQLCLEQHILLISLRNKKVTQAWGLHSYLNFICLGFYVAFNTVQVISRREGQRKPVHTVCLGSVL